jgi:hypothetical protein
LNIRPATAPFQRKWNGAVTQIAIPIPFGAVTQIAIPIPFGAVTQIAIPRQSYLQQVKEHMDQNEAPLYAAASSSLTAACVTEGQQQA